MIRARAAKRTLYRKSPQSSTGQASDKKGAWELARPVYM